MNISIVIPNYNGEKVLHKNLPSVLEASKEYKEGKVEIIIADDPSTDKSAQVIEQFIKVANQEHIVAKTIANKNRKEAGFSKNVNRGVSITTGEIIVLLNSDVRPHKDFLSPLVSHFTDPKVFAVGCMDESIEQGKVVLRGRGVGKWQKGLLVHGPGNLDQTNTLWVSGGSSAIRKSLWDKLRGLDVLYNPFYWEDIDLSYRALKAGYTIVFEPKSVVVHEHDEGAIKSKFKPFHIQKIAYRNQFIFIWKNITDGLFLFSHCLWLPYHLINALRSKDTAFLLGFVKALSMLPEILRVRSRNKRFIKLSDKEVLKEFSSE